MSTEPTTGSCLCGAIKYSFTGAPVSRVLILSLLFLSRQTVSSLTSIHRTDIHQILCHCLDCRKISGSHYADNALLASSQLTLVAGAPKTYTVEPKEEGPNSNITSHFCGDCGTTLWRSGEGFEGYVSVRLGTLDDPEWVGKMKPDGHYFEERKVDWLPELIGNKDDGAE